jgi:hypothetical protein
VNFGRTLTLVVALASGLCLSACEDAPSLSEMKEFQAYPVYYSGESVAGNSLREVLGDPSQYKDKRDTSWFLIYGKCKDRPDEGGCPYPLQIHNYSTCTRWAGLSRSRLFDFRGAKASKPMRGGAALEIFTGRTTVTIDAENQDVLDSALQGLRNVRRDRPSLSLPPPVPGSLSGELPCQKRSG